MEGAALAADDIGDAARNHFRAGVALLEDPDGAKYEEAYSEFKAAYAASRSPKVLGNVGYCAMMLERDGEAIEAYSRYLAEVDDVPKEEREQITRDLQTMRTGVVRVILRADLPDATVVDQRVPVRGNTVTNVYKMDGQTGSFTVRAGHHVIRLKMNGTESAPWDLEATPGGSFTHAFKLKPEPVPVRSSSSGSAMPWILVGAGSLMLAGSAATGLWAMARTNDLDRQCPNDVCPAGVGLDGERKDIRTLARITDGLLIGGGVTLLGGITWALLAGGSSKEKPPTNRASIRPDLVCSTVGCSGSLIGKF
jgi:hypothetical protein